jgi:hypothetical protein
LASLALADIQMTKQIIDIVKPLEIALDHGARDSACFTSFR